MWPDFETASLSRGKPPLYKLSSVAILWQTRFRIEHLNNELTSLTSLILKMSRMITRSKRRRLELGGEVVQEWYEQPSEGVQEPGITDLGITESGITESGITGGNRKRV